MLDGMAGSIYAGFKGQLRSGVIRRLGAAAGLDGHGRPQDRPPALHRFEGFIDDYSAFTRAQAGIPATSMRLNIFGASLPVGIIPSKDDLARVDEPAGPRWVKLLARVDVDPAGALYQCEAQAAVAPDGG